jgi:hypothetical protein
MYCVTLWFLVQMLLSANMCANMCARRAEGAFPMIIYFGSDVCSGGKEVTHQHPSHLFENKAESAFRIISTPDHHQFAAAPSFLLCCVWGSEAASFDQIMSNHDQQQNLVHLPPLLAFLLILDFSFTNTLCTSFAVHTPTHTHTLSFFFLSRTQVVAAINYQVFPSRMSR